MRIEVDQEVFNSFAFYSGILVAKILTMAYLTKRQRTAKKVYANPEDISRFPGSKVMIGDPDVERVRRAHLNDLENIMPFAIGFLYCFTSPVLATANLPFKGKLAVVFTVSRIVHTMVSAVWSLPQPARGLSFIVGMGVTAFMVSKVICHFA